MNCSNCEQPVKGKEFLFVLWDGTEKNLAQICSECTKDVLTLKIVLTRKDAKSNFTFEGYLPVSSVK